MGSVVGCDVPAVLQRDRVGWSDANTGRWEAGVLRFVCDRESVLRRVGE